METGGDVEAPAAPLLANEANIATFFLRDASVRLSRIVEYSLAYCFFVLLLYCRLLTPGGASSWVWYEQSFVWVMVFLPLFVLDWRNYQHMRYLKTHNALLPQNEPKRCAILICAEMSYKVLLCAYLSSGWVRSSITLQVVMLPFILGYVVNFILGHFLPLEDVDRPEGCNAIAGLVSEFGRFLQFVLIISLSLKVQQVSSVVYNWQAAFWPCWGLEGIIILIVMLLLPVCAVSLIVDRSRIVMLAWVVLSASGLGVATWVSMINISLVLDGHLCSQIPCQDSSSSACDACRYHLQLSMAPWLILLPFFALLTSVLKPHLATALHNTWFVSPGAGGTQTDPRLRETPPEELLPPPVVMFRITPTYYSRAFDPALLDVDCQHTMTPNTSMSQIHHTITPNASMSPANHTTLSGSYQAPGRLGPSSFASTSLTALKPSLVDHAASILSARGSNFGDIVEAEQLCFICYDSPPDAVLLECGHAGICVECATRLLERPGRAARCPICRGPISNALRLRPDQSFPPGIFAAYTRTSSYRSLGQQAGGAFERSATSLHSTSSARSHHSSISENDRPIITEEEAVASAIENAAALGQPMTSPPWPVGARRHAVVVESLRRVPERPVWRLSSLLTA